MRGRRPCFVCELDKNGFPDVGSLHGATADEVRDRLKVNCLQPESGRSMERPYFITHNS
ncbi:MAG: hypothetical protein K2M55_07215 [Muribaculaceae bacterium]|nr:hypothetical protein [Muribaculaceae bacterium]